MEKVRIVRLAGKRHAGLKICHVYKVQKMGRSNKLKRKRTEQTDEELEKEYNHLVEHREELKEQIKKRQEAIRTMEGVIEEYADMCVEIDEKLDSDKMKQFLYRKKLKELEMYAEVASKITSEKAAEAAAAAFHAEQILHELAEHKAKQ